MLLSFPQSPLSSPEAQEGSYCMISLTHMWSLTTWCSHRNHKFNDTCWGPGRWAHFFHLHTAIGKAHGASTYHYHFAAYSCLLVKSTWLVRLGSHAPHQSGNWVFGHRRLAVGLPWSTHKLVGLKDMRTTAVLLDTSAQENCCFAKDVL